MFRLEERCGFEQIVKKSLFRATAIPIETEDDAKRGIQDIALAAGANHNCWAWRIGQVYRFSDDGEPGGTAGKPILAAIDGQSVDGVLIVVSRWFGGVLLGTGGLVRAYGGTAAACLRAARLVAFRPTMTGTVRLQFSDLALVKARLSSIDQLQIVDQRYMDDGCETTLQVPIDEADVVSRLITELTSGRATLKVDP